MAKQIFTNLDLLWNELQNAIISGYVSDEQLAQIIAPIRSTLQEIKTKIDYLLYSKIYDLTDANISTDISGDNLAYDNELFCTKNNGNLTINTPRSSCYYLYLKLKDYGTATYITANNVQYPIQREMKIRFDNVTQISFSSDNYIWITEISIMEYKLPDIPTKLSQLENDQRFVASNVETETLYLTIKEKA